MLEMNRRFFESVREELAIVHCGKFALVKNGEVAAIYATFAHAYHAGVRMFGTEPFTVREI